MIFRCGWCLKECDEEEPRSFKFVWASPTGREPRSFYLCRECAKKLKPVKTPLFDTETLPVTPPMTTIFDIDWNKKKKRRRRNP